MADAAVNLSRNYVIFYQFMPHFPQICSVMMF